MRHPLFAFLLVSSLSLFSCASPIRSYEAPTVKTSQYHTFQWLTQEDADRMNLQNPKVNFITQGNIVITRDLKTEEKVKPLVISDLKKAGFTPTDGKPDFYVTFYAQKKNKDWLSSWKGTTAGVNEIPLALSPDFERDQIRAHRDYKVYVTIYDSKTQKPSWSGSAISPELWNQPNLDQLPQVISQIVTEFKEHLS